MLRILAGIILILVFIFSGYFFVQLIALALAVVVMPYSLFFLLPVTAIYDTVFSGSRAPIFSIATLIFILVFQIVKPYIRK